MAITVTAQQGGSTGASLVLRVFALTGAAASQTGASTNNQFSAATTWTQSITTTGGSNVYGAAAHLNGSADTGSNATLVDSIADATNSWQYVTFKALNVSAGATARGFTTVNPSTGPFAQLEILAAGTLAEDGSSPAVASGAGTSNLSVSTASFTPPAGALLVAIVSSNGGATVTTMTVSDSSSLSWSEKVKNNPSGGDYAGVWIAQVPAAAGGAAFPAQPGRTWLRRFHHRQQAFPAATVAAGPVSGPPLYPLGRPVQAKGSPQPGGRVASRDGTYAQAGSPVRVWDSPVRGQPAFPFIAGRADSRTGTRAGTGPPVRPLDGPVRAAQPLPARGRAQGHAGTFTAVAPVSGPPVYPLGHPVQARRLPQRGGSTASRDGIFAGSGPPVRQWDGPVRAAQPLPPHGRAQNRAGTYTAVVTGSGPPVYPLHGPVRTRPQPPPRGRIIRAAGTYAQAGPPVTPLRRPAGLGRQQPPPPARGRTASLRGPYAQAGPPVIRLRRPVRGQPQKPVLTGRAGWRAGTYTAPFVPPFTIGTLTAADTGTSALTAAGSSSTLTAAGAGLGTLTATSQPTGGPS